MAENQNPSSSSPTSTQQSQPTSRQSKGKVTILASVEDGVLQPDSMRGSEEHLKDLDVEDLEEERRETHRKLSEKSDEKKIP